MKCKKKIYTLYDREDGLQKKASSEDEFNKCVDSNEDRLYIPSDLGSEEDNAVGVQDVSEVGEKD